MLKKDRTGELNNNSNGYNMKIIKYNSARNISVLFTSDNYILNNVSYKEFKNGSIHSPFEKTICNIGYLGDGLYKGSIKGKHTKTYNTWQHMLKRCYNEKYRNKYPTYKNCTVNPIWHNFQNFAKWFDENYYEIENETMAIDKDILVKGNKIYSPETCVFVPQCINSLFTKCNKNRGNLPIGVTFHKRDNRYQVNFNEYNINKYLGQFDSPQQAFQIYKKYKEDLIKKIANKYKDKIPQNLYNALYKYIVEITD